MSKFNVGDSVIIKHQKDLGIFRVEVAFDKLQGPLKFLSNTIEGYVRIGNKTKSGLGYHEESLERVGNV